MTETAAESGGSVDPNAETASMPGESTPPPHPEPSEPAAPVRPAAESVAPPPASTAPTSEKSGEKNDATAADPLPDKEKTEIEDPSSARPGAFETDAPSRSLAEEVARELESAEIAVPLTTGLREFARLEINFNRVLVEGTAATIDLRLSALTVEPLLDVKLDLECPKALAEPVTERFATLERQWPAVSTGEFEMIPRSKGTRLLTCRCSFTQLGRRRTFEGKVPITILAEPSGTNVSLSLSEIGNQVIHGGGGNAGVGAENTVRLHDLVDFSKITTLNDLLGMKLPDAWVPVSLRQTADEPTGTRFIAPSFLREVHPATVLTLTPQRRDGREIPDALVLRVVARSEFYIGRRRDACDLVAWFLPRNDENDQLSRGISKVQAVGTVGSGGITFQVCPDTNGAYFNREPIELGGDGARLEEQARLALGVGPGRKFRIDLQHHPAQGSAPPEAENHRLWPGPAPKEKPVTGCVVLRPTECPPAFRWCIWLFTEAAFGSGKNNPIRLSDAGLASSQGLVHHYRGCFWIENSADEGTEAAVRVNGVRVKAGELVPLAPGMNLELGTQRFRVEVGN